METGANRNSPRIGRWLWLVFLLPLLASAGTRGLWAPDEPRYAEIAREAFQEGHWLVLHLCGEIYPDKPPLLYWIAGFLGTLSGWMPGAMRLVSVAAALGSGILVARMARRWWGELEAAIAPALLLGVVLWMDIGGRLQIDPLLAFLVLQAIELGDRPASDARTRGRNVLWAGLAAGLGALAKGPVAWLCVGLVFLSWRVAGPAAPGPRAKRGALIGAVLLAVLPVGLWAGAAIASEPALARDLLFDQHVGRNVGSVPHAGPPWKHLLRMPIFLLPWTPFVFLGLRAGWRVLRRKRGSGSDGGDAERGLARATLWLLSLFVIFSLMPPKRDLYLLPAYPAASLLAAYWVAQRLRASEGLRWPFAVVGILLTLGGVASLAVLPFLGRIEVAAALPHITARLLIFGSTFALLGIYSLRLVRTGEWLRAFRSSFVAWALAGAVAALALYPAIDPVKSSRSLAERVAELPQHPRMIPCKGVRPEGYRFYSGLPFVASKNILEDLRELAAGGDAVLALVREKDWEKLSEESRAPYGVLFSQYVGSRNILVIVGEHDLATTFGAGG